LKNAVGAGLPLCDAVRMLGENPAELFSLDCGAIAQGRDADLLICDGDLNIEKVILKGEEL
jgi:N-acetylglucosamine-6-phosphate deacetylase